MTDPRFRIVATRGAARAGVLTTAHGAILTPAFLARADAGIVPGHGPDDLEGAGIGVVGASSLDLSVRPGSDAIQRSGGLHAFVGWSHPILVDGGTERLAELRDASAGHGRLVRVDVDGATFASPVDGSPQRVTPGSALSAIAALGADLAVPLYYPGRGFGPRRIEGDDIGAAWAGAALYGQPGSKALFLRGITVGPGNEGIEDVSTSDPRPDGIALLARYCTDGFASILERAPMSSIRYLGSDGGPEDLGDALQKGFDLVSSGAPVRDAANGWSYTSSGRASVLGDAGKGDGPIEVDCPCLVCTRHGRPYVHHLFDAHELLGPRLLGIHNLAFVARLFARFREGLLGS